MKKILTVIVTSIVSLIITFILAEMFSIYHFKDIPTLPTFSYLLSAFCIIEYIFLMIFYIIMKKKNKVKIESKKIISMLLVFISLLLMLGFITFLDIDWLNHYLYSTPFYINVIGRSLQFILPSIILLVISMFLLRKGHK